MLVAMINAHMIGTPSEPGEHVDWDTPDVFSEAEWFVMLGMSVADYASRNPHMIVMEV